MDGKSVQWLLATTSGWASLGECQAGAKKHCEHNGPQLSHFISLEEVPKCCQLEGFKPDFPFDIENGTIVHPSRPFRDIVKRFVIGVWDLRFAPAGHESRRTQTR